VVMENFRVLLVLDAALEWSREVVLGFGELAREQGWCLLHYHSNVEMDWLLESWKPAAVVIGPEYSLPWPAQLRHAVCVSVNRDRTQEGIASIVPDERAVARLAFEHLAGRGLSEVTTFRFSDSPFAASREAHFIEAAERKGVRVAPGWWLDEANPPRSTEDPRSLAAWLSGLPQPCGIFACCDPWARVVARYALVAGRRVPEDLGIIGVDNDWFECSTAVPPLSSVAVPWRTVGRRAAELVRRGLAGARLEGDLVMVPPSHVVARRSTEVEAVSDELVARTIAFIHEHVQEPLSVPKLARAVASTRQRLERRFRNALGRTVAAEIRRARVEVARGLLATTDHKLSDIASQCGFSTSAILSETFRRELGVAPGAYRRRLRGALD